MIMKKYIILTTAIITSLFLKLSAQEIRKDSVFNDALKTQITYSVYLPKNWSPDKKYPQLYLTGYGPLQGNGLLIAAHINNFINNFPASIVVEIDLKMSNLLGYDYEKGNVNQKGIHFIQALQKQIIPQIKSKYGGSKFRAFIGQSYSATYTHYLYLNYPEIFNAYVLFNPESIGQSQMDFKLSDKNKQAKEPSLYYIGSSKNDVDRRKVYADTLFNRIRQLDTNIITIKKDNFEEADHNNIVNYAILPSLKFLFSRYQIQDSYHGGDLNLWFKNAIIKGKELYGEDFNPLTKESFYNILDFASQQNSIDFFTMIMEEGERNSVITSLNYFNAAYISNTTFKNNQLAEKYSKKSILQAKSDHEPFYQYQSSNWLAKKIYLKENRNFQLAWKTMTDLEHELKIPLVYYSLAELALEDKNKIDNGIKYIQSYFSSSLFTEFYTSLAPFEAGHVIYSKLLWKKGLKKQAKEELQKAIAINPNFTNALEWQKEMR
jgi:predicted alpha/beta superfamily hydrolase